MHRARLPNRKPFAIKRPGQPSFVTGAPEAAPSLVEAVGAEGEPRNGLLVGGCALLAQCVAVGRRGLRAERLIQVCQRRFGGRLRRAFPVEKRFCVVDADGEAQPLVRRNIQGRNANHVARAFEQRSSAVPRVDRGVGLNQRNGAHLPDGTDNATRHCVLKDPEWRTERDDFLAGTNSC